MDLAIFNFLIECVSGRACILSNEKCRSLFGPVQYTAALNHEATITAVAGMDFSIHVLMLLYIESIGGQFPIQTATHSF